MVIHQQDTIAAVSTPPGEGGIAVIRISGKDSYPTIKSIFRALDGVSEIPDHSAVHGWIMDGNECVDEVIVTFFHHPRSYTGDDVIEISCHGSPFISRRILEMLFQKGVRPAKPGEFTLHAFLNGKMDLTQAEAVADLIHAKTEASRKIAVDQLDGHLSKRIQNIRKQLIHACSLLEIELDFAHEDIQFASKRELETLLEKCRTDIEALIDSFNRGRICREGIRIVLIGKPNVGKSSILNCLLEKERAIVTDIPGTTRDTVEDILDIRGVLAYITDTAGICETSDPIEKEGVFRAEQALGKADLVLLVFDKSTPINTDDEQLYSRVRQIGKESILIVNKTDLTSAWELDRLPNNFPNTSVIEISTITGEGIQELVKALEAAILSDGLMHDGEVMLNNVRHMNCLVKAKNEIQKAEASLFNGMSEEFVAVDLRGALEHLGEITGQFVDDEILEKIFSSFCIGK
jgi:tRNA modification GTPase